MTPHPQSLSPGTADASHQPGRCPLVARAACCRRTERLSLGLSQPIPTAAPQRVMHGYIESVEPVGSEDSDLAKVTTNHLPRSETDVIHAVDIPAHQVTLCDTPGFDDTSGVEQDIANGLAIVRAVQRCRSVRPLVVIHAERVGGRWEGVSQLAHTLVKLIGELERTKAAPPPPPPPPPPFATPAGDLTAAAWRWSPMCLGGCRGPAGFPAGPPRMYHPAQAHSGQISCQI